MTSSATHRATPSGQGRADSAGRPEVDRTTMVALIDGPEDQGLVRRRRCPQDRRKKIVELTPDGEDCLRQGEKALRAAQRGFLAQSTRKPRPE